MAPPASLLRRYEEDVKKIEEFSDDTVRELVEALETAPLTVGVETMVPEVASKVKGIQERELSELIPSLLSLCTIRDQFESSSREVAEILSRDKEGEQRSRLESRLTELLEAHSLNVVAKAGALMIEHPRFMRRARILTDIRPIFGSSPDAPPTAAVVVHTLRLSYFEDNETKEFFVALDAEDVRTLSVQLNRATSKAKSLKAIIDKIDIDYVDSE